MGSNEIKAIIEALIFASETPLSPNKIRDIIGDDITLKDIRNILQELINEYSQNKRGFYLKEVANGYQFRTRPDYAIWVKRLKKPKTVRFSQPTLETLAIIAYKQPITRPEIEKIRGVDCSGPLRFLLENKLITIKGRKQIPGRPYLFITTQRFLEVFGLESLGSLPPIKELEKLGKENLSNLLSQNISPSPTDSSTQ